MALSVSGVVPTPLARARRQIWSVGGGKGGIGKSILTASLGWPSCSNPTDITKSAVASPQAEAPLKFAEPVHHDVQYICRGVGFDEDK